MPEQLYREDPDGMEAVIKAYETFCRNAHTPHFARASNFAAWTPRTSIARFMASAEIFQHVLPIPGVIVEGGVGLGSGVYTWLHLSSILEMNNYTRRVIGFDLAPNELMFGELLELQKFHDLTRPFGSLTKLELVKGDACETMPQYVGDHPGLMVSLLMLDFTETKPTRIALESFYPLMPRGGIVVAGGIFPEETAELPMELDWRRFPYCPTLIWARKI